MNFFSLSFRSYLDFSELKTRVQSERVILLSESLAFNSIPRNLCCLCSDCRLFFFFFWAVEVIMSLRQYARSNKLLLVRDRSKSSRIYTCWYLSNTTLAIWPNRVRLSTGGSLVLHLRPSRKLPRFKWNENTDVILIKRIFGSLRTSWYPRSSEQCLLGSIRIAINSVISRIEAKP